MHRRADSPALSENQFDIADCLVGDEDVQLTKKRKYDAFEQTNLGFNVDDILHERNPNVDDSDSAEAGDEAFIALQQAASFRKNANVKGRSVKKGGGFQSMGLSSNLLRAIARKGFSVPTPIQRKTIPLIMDRRDVVGMARTGSGKTGAFVIPMVERLRAHSARVGSRALILSPSRELALQTLKVVKELSRGTDLKSVLLIGGDSLEEQFGMMATNPDIIIATPGRFLHLKVEMSLDLSAIQYVVFDEADRLFEMGFAVQLTEILHALPTNRQTLLFSATLPKSLVEFAQAGLQDPSLVRLDVETKISPDLQSAFFSVKSSQKEGALIYILGNVIKMPKGLPIGIRPGEESNDEDEEGEEGKGGGKHFRKRKRGPNRRGKPTEHSTIIFTATKYHVDYLASLLRESDYSVSYVYGSLDQAARRSQVSRFCNGKTNILVVTDVAARGIDIPVLANVINYDFPPQPKVYVHRVGRTARAGQRGWSYSLVQSSDVPYLLDLQLFLGRKLIIGQSTDDENVAFANDVIVGALPRDELSQSEELAQNILGSNDDIRNLRTVVVKAEKLYKRTRNSASAESAKRARDIVTSDAWTELHMLFGKDASSAEKARTDMLARIGGYRPPETIFEFRARGKAGMTEAAAVMKSLRAHITPRRPAEAAEAAAKQRQTAQPDDEPEPGLNGDGDSEDDDAALGGLSDLSEIESGAGIEDESDSDVEVTVSNTGKALQSFQDSEHFLSYKPRSANAIEEKGYGVHSGGNFVSAARDATMDLTTDETKTFGMPSRPKFRWDSKAKKYMATSNDEDGSRGAKMIRGESGMKIASSFQSGRFEKWKRARRLGLMPRVGEEEKDTFIRRAADDVTAGARNIMPNGLRYKHKSLQAPKDADKYRDDYHVRKKRVIEAKEKRIGRFADGSGNRKELKDREDMWKARVVKQQKKEKNARTPHNKKKGGRPKSK